ncbi:MAG TPA: hypothetical protein VKB93_28865 [Thermoanaerobaculia bacterium]|nr:hypothetical protein [Thermoanaerobaculia bacterium]
MASLVALSAIAAEALFPQPLHLVRRVEDPFAGKTATLHEYCAGDQVVTVNGAHVVIADYGKQQLIEIDRAAGTYSVTRFEELAKLNAAPPPAAALTNDNIKLDVKVDRTAHLSRAAVEVLIGAAYPNARRAEHEQILRAAAGSERGKGLVANSADAPPNDYALPVEQTLTILEDGERITMRNTILEVRRELPPDDLRLIPPGARLVESRATRLARELRDLDHLH